VLRWIRSDVMNQYLEVIILTSSPEERDKETAAHLGAKAYLVKPPTPESLLEVFNQFHPPEQMPSISQYAGA
jgi:CheY-like chemotaxis protein